MGRCRQFGFHSENVKEWLYVPKSSIISTIFYINPYVTGSFIPAFGVIGTGPEDITRGIAIAS